MVVICYGFWLFVELVFIDGCEVMFFFSIKIDLINVGVKWVDKEVVIDGKLVISCNFDDILVFVVKIIELVV